MADLLIRRIGNMAAAGSSTSREREERFKTPFTMGSLWRLASGGAASVLALAIAVAAGFSENGSQRLVLALSPNPPPERAYEASRAAEANAALLETVRLLAAERDRLAARMARLERHFDDLTSSIATASQPAVPTSPSAPGNEIRQRRASEPTQTAGITELPAERVEQAHSAATSSTVSSTNEPAKGEYGADIGAALNFEGLRTLWSATKASNPDVFENLYPLVSVQENSRTRAPQLRLIVGPFADWEAVDRFCAAVTGARVVCQATAFAGQRLADAERPAERKAAGPRQRVAPSAQPRLFGLF